MTWELRKREEATRVTHWASPVVPTGIPSSRGDGRYRCAAWSLPTPATKFLTGIDACPAERQEPRPLMYRVHVIVFLFLIPQQSDKIGPTAAQYSFPTFCSTSSFVNHANSAPLLTALG